LPTSFESRRDDRTLSDPLQYRPAIERECDAALDRGQGRGAISGPNIVLDMFLLCAIENA
jgi:hypothetical protein